MKKIFAFLQRLDVAVMIAVVFIGAPHLVNQVATTLGVGAGLALHLFLLATAVILTVFFFWTLVAKWNVEKIGILIASSGAGLGGLIITLNLLAGIYQWVSPSWFGYFHKIGSAFITATVVWGAIVEYVYLPWIDKK